MARPPGRNDWFIPPAIQQAALEFLGDMIDGTKPRSNRERLSAARTLAMFKRLGVAQQKYDLMLAKQNGKVSEVSLSDLVNDAERRAAQRKHERETKATK
jgi:hypothetical protein